MPDPRFKIVHSLPIRIIVALSPDLPKKSLRNDAKISEMFPVGNAYKLYVYNVQVNFTSAEK